MTLTEQWKKGELEVGEEYWVILTDEWYLRSPVVPVRAFYSCECEFEGYLDNDIKEVLAPVPSYEEWQELTTWNKEYKIRERNYGESYEALKKENAQLHKFLEEFNALDVAKENLKLKELLKEAKDIIEWYKADCGYKDTPTEAILTKIDNAIGEK